MKRANCLDGESSGPAENTRTVRLSTIPFPPVALPMMSLLKTASMGTLSAAACCAWRRAHEALFLAGHGHEDQRGIELHKALGHDPGCFHREYRAAAIVVRSRGEIVPGAPVEGPRPRNARQAVEVTGDVDASRTAAREDSHDIAQLDLAGDTTLGRDLVAIETGLESGRVRPELSKDPLACRANTPTRRVPQRRHGVTGLETLESLQVGLELRRGHLGERVGYPSIDRWGLRRPWHGQEQRQGDGQGRSEIEALHWRNSSWGRQ